MKKQSLIKGTFILGFAGIFARFLGLFFRIPIQALIHDDGMGYYQMSYPLYMTFVAVASGIPIAMSKLISEMNSQNDMDGINEVLKQTLVIMIPLGMLVSLLMFIFAHPIINSLKWDKNSYYSFVVIAMAPIFVSIMCTFRGFFQGLQNMQPTAISQIIEQVGRVVAGVLFAYLLYPKGIAYAAAGAACGTVVGGMLGSLYLMITYQRVKREFKGKCLTKRKRILSQIAKAALPISLGAAVGTVMSLIDSILVPQQLLKAGINHLEAAKLYGQLTGKAYTLSNVPLALSVALSASLVPIIAEAYYNNRRKELLSKVEMAIKLSSVIALPSALGLYFMAKPVMNLVFLKDIAGYKILQYLAISIPFIILSQTSTAILQSAGRYMKPVYNLAIGCVVKVVTTYILVSIPYINIYGAVIATILGYITSCGLNMYALRKNMNIKINYYDVTIKPAYASVLMIMVVVFSYRNVYNYTKSSNLSCVSSIFIGAIVYSLLIILFRIFKYSDIKEKFSKKQVR